MKYRFLILIILFATLSCSEDYPETYQGDAYLGFAIGPEDYRIYVQQYFNNFYYYDDSTVARDTVYVAMNAVGAIPNKDIAVKIKTFDSETRSYPERIDQTTENAVSGVHYVPFESDEMTNLLKFHANKMQDTIPIILLNDASLKETTYRLTFQLDNLENALVTDNDENRVVIYISNRVSKPSNWNDWEFGIYSDVKIDFMIRHSDLKWNEEDMEMVLNDAFLLSYYKYKFKEDLIKENEALGSDGPLVDANGQAIKFSLF
ncbi:DUF4843 domain-containing protein [Thalassobellus citreus]|uniref:DUF4843 domain-containing protein n=1 Tax=Thalassobellus citreus TaxID=3367752 RepID=UPI0037894D45